MNGKQAKRLRRAAQGLAETFSNAGRKITERGLEFEQHITPDTSSLSSSTTAVDNSVLRGITIHNKRDSVRGMYRSIKKGVVSGKIGKP